MKIAFTLVFLTAWILSGCGGDKDSSKKSSIETTDEPAALCVPNQTDECPCGGGTIGMQTCSDDGTRYLDRCDCSGIEPSTNDEPTPVSPSDTTSPIPCVPNRTESCLCASGVNGRQTCTEDGLSFTTCECPNNAPQGSGGSSNSGNPDAGAEQSSGGASSNGGTTSTGGSSTGCQFDSDCASDMVCINGTCGSLAPSTGAGGSMGSGGSTSTGGASSNGGTTSTGGAATVGGQTPGNAMECNVRFVSKQQLSKDSFDFSFWAVGRPEFTHEHLTCLTDSESLYPYGYDEPGFGMNCKMPVSADLTWQFVAKTGLPQGAAAYSPGLDGEINKCSAYLDVTLDCGDEFTRDIRPLTMVRDGDSCVFQTNYALWNLNPQNDPNADADGDSVKNGDDCAPQDPSTHPQLTGQSYRHEVCGDEWDGNCDLQDCDPSDLAPSGSGSLVYTLVAFDLPSSGTPNLVVSHGGTKNDCWRENQPDPMDNGVKKQAIVCTVTLDPAEMFEFNLTYNGQQYSAYYEIQGNPCLVRGRMYLYRTSDNTNVAEYDNSGVTQFRNRMTASYPPGNSTTCHIFTVVAP